MEKEIIDVVADRRKKKVSLVRYRELDTKIKRMCKEKRKNC